jgi:uncharacterized protein
MPFKQCLKANHDGYPIHNQIESPTALNSVDAPMKTRVLTAGVVVISLLAALAVYLYASRPATAGVAMGVPRNAAVDVLAVRARAEAGDAKAQVQLGGLYTKGELVTNSYAEAAKWYQKAAAQGDPEGELALGELYQAGQGLPRDITNAVKWYRLAAGKGSAGAQYTLGFMYETGQGLPVDQKEASQWFRRAAEAGEPLAQFDLGQRYELGVGVPVDRVEAYIWLSLAAGNGQPDSAERLKRVAAKMTHEEIKAAKRRAAEFSAQKKPRAMNSTAACSGKFTDAARMLPARQIAIL